MSKVLVALLAAVTLSATAENIPDLSAPLPTATGDARVPDFLKAGMRLTYFCGESTVAGLHWVPDPHGPVKDKNGQRYRPEASRGGGGLGFQQLSILHADAKVIAADGRNYGISAQNDRNFNPEMNVVSLAGGGASVLGSADGLEDIWIPPAKLAAMPGGRADDRTVFREPYRIGNHDFKAIEIADGKNHISTHIYDLQSGLLLFAGTIDLDPDLVVVDPTTGRAERATGNHNYSHRMLYAVRQTKVPWAAEPSPDWVKRGAQLSYQGGVTALIEGGFNVPQTPRAATLSIRFDNVTAGCAVATALYAEAPSVGMELMKGPPTPRCFGPAQFTGLWIPPRALRDLKEDRLLDEDPVTHFRTSYAGMRDNFALIVEQGSQDAVENFYDPQNGVLAYQRITRAAPTIGRTVTQLQLQNRP